VVEARFLERRGALRVQADARGQQIGVVAQPPCLGDQDFQIIAQQRLAAREAALDRTELAGLAQYAQPLVGRQLVRMPIEVDRGCSRTRSAGDSDR